MRRLALAPLLLAIVACGAPAATTAVGGTSSEPPATTAPATTPPPVSPRTTTPPPATSPATTAPATTAPATPPATTAPTARGDVDGDGSRDSVRVVERPGSLASGTWDLTVVLAGGRGTVTGVLRAEPQVRPSVLGVTDADGDGDGEVFVRVGGGASTTAYVPFALVEDGLAEVRTPDGRTLRLLAGGSVTHGDGFSCADVHAATGRELVVLSVVSDDGSAFRGTRRTYRWRSDRVELLATTTFTGAQGDPAVTKSYEADCEGL